MHPFEFIARVIRFRKNRRISKYNPRIKTELEPDYLIHDDKLLPREKLKRAYESIKGKVVGGEENAISADINSDNLHIYYDDDENFIEKPEELKTHEMDNILRKTASKCNHGTSPKQ